jgi:6,7-dimethyl-8-ribityllumazine synthase
MSSSDQQNNLLSLKSISFNKNFKIAIVCTEWNETIVNEQYKGAIEFNACEISKFSVPGAVEIPYACKQLIDTNQYDAIITFGAVIKGGTPHFDYVCDMVSQGISTLNITQNTPIIFGVLTVNNDLQAWDRLGGAHGHKGKEAAITALKMIHFKRSL